MNDKLTPKEQYQLRKKQRKKERQREIQKKKIKKTIIILLSTVLIIGGLVFGIVNYSPEKSHSGTPKIEINPPVYDAGIVSMAKGKIQHTYEIKNNGDGDLKIDKIWTSCMCTTARLKVGDKISPEFGMHDNPLFWSQKIAPGQAGYLEVTFDPAFHGPQGIGSVIRAVYLSTNDPKVSKAEARLIANVIP